MNDLEFIKDYLNRYNKLLFETDISEKLIKMKRISWFRSKIAAMVYQKPSKIKSLLNIEDESKLKKIEEHNTLINNVNRHYPNFNQNTQNLIEFIENPISLKCIRNDDHIMNENIFEAMEELGPILIFAVFCENIIINDLN